MTNRRRITCAALAICTSAAGFPAAASPSDAPSAQPPSHATAAETARDRARREIFSRTAILIAVPEGEGPAAGKDDPLVRALQDLVERVGRFGEARRVRLVVDEPAGPLILPREDEFLVAACATPVDLPGPPGALASSGRSTRRIRGLLARLPLRFDGGPLVFAGRPAPAAEATLVTLAPDPGRGGRLAIVCAGRNPRSVARAVASLLLTGPDAALGSDDYRLRPGGLLDRRGRYEMPLQGAWTLDSAHQQDGEAERDAWLAALVPVRSGSVTARVPAAMAAAARPWVERRSSFLARQPGGSRDGSRPVEFTVYDDLVRLGRYTGQVAPVSSAVGAPPRAAASPGGPGAPAVPSSGVAGPSVAPAAIRFNTLLDASSEPYADLEAGLAVAAVNAGSRAGGPAASAGAPPRAEEQARPWLARGEVVAAMGTWKGRSPAAWCAVFRAAGVLPSLEQLQSAEMADDQSPLVFLPAAARAREVVSARFGRDRWEAYARGAPPDEGLRQAWLKAGRAEPPVPRAARPGPERLASFEKGVCLAHVNDLSRGYASAAARSTLEHLKTLGVRSISVTPFGFTRTAADPDVGFVLDSPGSETDSQMLAILASARAAGMAVLYKPHIWVGEGGWAGRIEMKDDAGWRRFFEGYRRFIVHHALLAAEGGAEGFVVGTEMVRSSARADDWRSLIDSVRRVFPGWVTYAANWDEYDRVGFWDALDAVGVDLYEPLSLDPAATDAGLLAGASATAARIAKYAREVRRPLLLTELGAPSRPRAWLAPHEEADGDPPDELAQERIYRALIAAWSGRPELRGAWWWKYESAPLGARDANGLTPRGKRAEQALAGWFRSRARQGAQPGPDRSDRSELPVE